MKNNKYFIITIDTEADNQWNLNQECTTENAKYLPKFQELAEKYGYKPVWLTTYEMANDENFVKYFKQKQEKGLCEMGMHLHAWNTPPYYKLEKMTNERSYLIEYPVNIMEKKIKMLDKLLTEKFGIKPISHRAGRWVMNDNYFKLLKKYNYKIDCSVTPHINWKKALGQLGTHGSNYANSCERAYMINDSVLEVPMTIRKSHTFQIKRIKNIKRFFREIELFIIGRNQWIRPDGDFAINGMIDVIKKCNRNNEYIMFMIHSSELMPGGSPNFKDEKSIEKLYNVIEEIFKYTNDLGYIGVTLREFNNIYNK